LRAIAHAARWRAEYRARVLRRRPGHRRHPAPPEPQPRLPNHLGRGHPDGRATDRPT